MPPTLVVLHRPSHCCCYPLLLAPARPSSLSPPIPCCHLSPASASASGYWRTTTHCHSRPTLLGLLLDCAQPPLEASLYSPLKFTFSNYFGFRPSKLGDT
uniref:Uncharacterized protein n=1 Tax=Opuntia streptacantha TaxID=393608 RepID=A0A7C8YQ29_OPUST